MAAVTAPASSVLSWSDCTYTSCYCEENVYLLVKQLVQQQQHKSSQLFAVFISNTNESVPFWFQRASRSPGGVVVWDYHVIALEVCGCRGVLVWDLDLKHPYLQFPCSLRDYAQHVLQSDAMELPHDLQRLYRLVPAAPFLQHFASDRSHMRRQDGSWCAEPPQYPCITAADGCCMNLMLYRDMRADNLQGSSAQHGGTGHMQALPAAAGGGSSVKQSQHACHAADALSHHQNTLQGGEAVSIAAACASVTVAAESAPAPGHASSGDHAAPAGGSVAHVSWQAVVNAAERSKYGVVLDESTLLGCLLGDES